MWRSVGFLMSFAVVLQGMTLMAYMVILGGGKQKRETGWRILTLFLVFISLVQLASMGLVVSPVSWEAIRVLRAILTIAQSYLYDNDERFYPGWKLDISWTMCVVSMCLSVFAAIVIWWSTQILPSEGGYELIADHD
jgi:hypothetical protein